jgi:hypothetical protein
VAATRKEPQWESLIKLEETERSVAAAPAANPARRPPWVWPSVAAGVLVLGMFAAWLGGVFKVKTPEGVIVLENLPKDAEVFVDKASPSPVPSPPAETGDPFPMTGTPYRLINVQSGKALEARGRIVVQADVSDSENQCWYLSQTPNASKYKIFNSTSDLMININNAGTPERFSIILYPDIGAEAGEDSAVWFLHSEGRAVRIATTWPGAVSSYGVNVLKIPDGSKDEERVVQRPKMGGQNELWEWIDDSPKTRAVGTGGPQRR